ncbi:5'-3' exonuclease [Georgenia thermotolerans]|uniref:5'-3' exonuclease n=1 Tax=Georgenia thermotolerans TaxID=527326 RepID=A0A7J5UKZ9_9MICO|nr:5'-3' exonuclease H3TH domain-containing protein [Georgenia thermotolerans]KAE8763065.1 flap endonuclease [Georgenia thermotolerans]
MRIHLVDGTYELFRQHFSPANKDADRGATRGVVASCLGLLEQGATHVAVATDHVIESFRNAMWPTYKDGAGVDPHLTAQFPLVEAALTAFGFPVWPMVEQEADDALAAAARVAAADPRVERVAICTPDKDLAQCVGGKVWQWDRRQDKWFDTDGVRARLGVAPASVPDLLALVGDSADGFPGLPGWGAKSAAAVLDRFGHLEDIPTDPLAWDTGVRSAAKLNAVLREQWDLALLFRDIATARTDAPVGTVDEWRWAGPTAEAAAMAAELDAPRLRERAERLAARVG